MGWNDHISNDHFCVECGLDLDSYPDLDLEDGVCSRCRRDDMRERNRLEAEDAEDERAWRKHERDSEKKSWHKSRLN
jgi:hypothetical protein